MNQKEQRCFEALTRAGYIVLRRGWPDFLVVSPDRLRGFAIEFKADGDRLSREQEQMHAVLSQLGLLVRVWKEPDLKAFRGNGRYGRQFLFPENLREARDQLGKLAREQADLAQRVDDLRRTLDESCTAVEQVYEAETPQERQDREYRDAISKAMPDLRPVSANGAPAP